MGARIAHIAAVHARMRCDYFFFGGVLRRARGCGELAGLSGVHRVCVIKSPLPPAPPAGCIFAALAITQARCTLSLRGGRGDGDSPTRTHGAIPRRVFSLYFPLRTTFAAITKVKMFTSWYVYEAKLHRGPAGRADQKKDALVKI
jgi:hypothetical protein